MKFWNPIVLMELTQLNSNSDLNINLQTETVLPQPQLPHLFPQLMIHTTPWIQYLYHHWWQKLTTFYTIQQLVYTHWHQHQCMQHINDSIYNYTKVLCHYGSLVLEFRDNVREGNGECVYHCWRVMLSHFLASRHTKYSLGAWHLQFKSRNSYLRTWLIIGGHLIHQRWPQQNHSVWPVQWTCQQINKGYNCIHGS